MCKAITIGSKKHFFSLNYHCFFWSPKNPLKVPWKSRTLRPLRGLQGTSPRRRVSAGVVHIAIGFYWGRHFIAHVSFISIFFFFLSFFVTSITC